MASFQGCGAMTTTMEPFGHGYCRSYGIEFYPIHGGSLYLGHNTDYVESLWAGGKILVFYRTKKTQIYGMMYTGSIYRLSTL